MLQKFQRRSLQKSVLSATVALLGGVEFWGMATSCFLWRSLVLQQCKREVQEKRRVCLSSESSGGFAPERIEKTNLRNQRLAKLTAMLGDNDK